MQPPPPPPPLPAADDTRAALDQATLDKTNRLNSGGGNLDTLNKQVVNDNIQQVLKPKMKALWKSKKFADKNDYKTFWKLVQKKAYRQGFELPSEALRTLVLDIVKTYFETHDTYEPGTTP